jgi:membrane peptidoglycan carboxypeptidase
VGARRLAVAVAAAVVLAAPSLATLWVWTPSGSDVQARVQAATAAHGVPVLRPDQVPRQLAEAVVAIEDERFYEHHGIDSIGLGRALLYDASNVCLCQGGSTITEQLVKDLYLGGSDRGYNKLEDVVLALKVERVLSKQEILADYLSEITTGFGRYGVLAAACAYFHSPLDRLTLGQYALLAGVAQAPSVYDPTVNPGAAQLRRSHVLAQMVSVLYISPAQAAAANAEPVLAKGPGC